MNPQTTILKSASKTVSLIWEVDRIADNSVTRSFNYHPGGAMRIDSTFYYVFKDYLVSASEVNDASGNIVVSSGIIKRTSEHMHQFQAQ